MADPLPFNASISLFCPSWSISKSKLEKVLKTLFYKPQANTVNPRFAPTRLYLLKHVQEALQTPPSPKPIQNETKQFSINNTHFD